jgi:predicted PurR-regulated permease PerM
LTGTFVSVVVVGCLYWAQVVFIPLALAVFLTFLLSPLVLVLQRRGLGRIPSVVLVVALAALALGIVGWVVTREMTSLIAELPRYTENVKAKVRAFREMGKGSGTGKLEDMVREVTGELTAKPAGPQGVPQEPAAPARVGRPDEPAKVVVEPESSAWLSRLPGVLSPVLGPFGAVGLASVLAVFMLLKREDLRNRFIRLMGSGRMAVTTKAVDEAGTRISRYLLMQLVVNGTYGLAWGLGLFLIGVDHALLWGFLAAILRYVPYIGAPIAALVPLALSVVQFEGWTQPLLVVGLLLLLELLSNNVMEPWLYSQSIGVSEVALLVAAAFWAFLWGPIGLVLAGPLTVCLVVLGKYVPQLEFFDVLLGDEPALDPEISYYQRLLAADQDEASELVQTYGKTFPPEQVYDGLLVPALTYAKRDRERDELTEQDERFIFQATREILEDLGERQADAPSEGATESPRDGAGATTRVSLVGCPARDEADRLALEMLRQLLDPARWEMEITAVEMLSAELVTLVAEKEPAILCIGALPPGGLAHTRYLCKRLRARFPKMKIVVGRWGLKGKVEENQEQLRSAGADQVETTLLETRNHLVAWFPVLSQQALAPSPGGAAKLASPKI